MALAFQSVASAEVSSDSVRSFWRRLQERETLDYFASAQQTHLFISGIRRMVLHIWAHSPPFYVIKHIWYDVYPYQPIYEVWNSPNIGILNANQYLLKFDSWWLVIYIYLHDISSNRDDILVYSAYPYIIHICIHIYIYYVLVHLKYIHNCTFYTCTICIYIYIHMYIHTYIHTYMHACIHTYIHACMHTYIHTYIHT